MRRSPEGAETQRPAGWLQIHRDYGAMSFFSKSCVYQWVVDRVFATAVAWNSGPGVPQKALRKGAEEFP